MTDETYEMLQEWLISGTELQKMHARFRLDMPDAAKHELDGRIAPMVIPVAPRVPLDFEAPVATEDPPAPKVPYPSLAKMAGNAAAAMADVAKGWFKGGQVRVAKEEQERRFAICQSCTEWFDPEKERCRHPRCGCYMRLKTWLASQRCPIGKWESVSGGDRPATQEDATW